MGSFICVSNQGEDFNASLKTNMVCWDVYYCLILLIFFYIIIQTHKNKTKQWNSNQKNQIRHLTPRGITMTILSGRIRTICWDVYSCLIILIFHTIYRTHMTYTRSWTWLFLRKRIICLIASRTSQWRFSLSWTICIQKRKGTWNAMTINSLKTRE